MSTRNRPVRGRARIAALAAPLLFLAAPLSAAEYWTYNAFEGEWEQHHPTRGIETEHDYDEDGYEVEREAEQYEYEPGVGYHEQEWYDPSDWFEIGRDFDDETELDDEAYGDFGRDYGWYYDDMEDEWAYGRQPEDAAD
jgi:hypothetical protein